MKRHMPKPSYASTCPATGRRGYMHRPSAKENLKKDAQRYGRKVSRLRVYQCDHCPMWHIGEREASHA